MNITFLFGNGFDLQLGMKTRYSHFYNYYKKLPTPENKPAIKELKDKLSDDDNNWSDFELEFGSYCKEFISIEDFETVFDDVSTELAKYISQKQNRFNFDVDFALSIIQCLGSPEKFLQRADREKIEGFKKNWANHSPWYTNLITFNYSTSLENLLKKINLSNNISVQGVQKQLKINPVIHIHGTTSEYMVLGVNEISQISNTKLRENPYVISALVKPECN
ncbi:MAG: bacteriophage abortive infection AbiH family protein [Rikenellaceae bacterium]|nr:bacteriophage abortive infection AbiH family protein [Rikenellaceae bacterium]